MASLPTPLVSVLDLKSFMVELAICAMYGKSFKTKLANKHIITYESQFGCVYV